MSDLDKALADLPAATTLDGTEILYLVQSGTDRKVTVDDLGSINHGGATIVASGAMVNKNTTTAEESLVSFDLPANALATDGDILVVECSGDILANSGSPTFTWKFKNGSVSMDTPAAAMTISANLRRWKLRAVIRRQTANTQTVSALLDISQAVATTTFNLADPAHTWVGNLTDISATDFTAPNTVAFTVQMSVSHANNRVRMYGFTAYTTTTS